MALRRANTISAMRFSSSIRLPRDRFFSIAKPQASLLFESEEASRKMLCPNGRVEFEVQPRFYFFSFLLIVVLFSIPEHRSPEIVSLIARGMRGVVCGNVCIYGFIEECLALAASFGAEKKLKTR